ncbi:MAG: LamG-like jellyroll fold domain-containing protein [bacterium]|nr:LamG-like jellyroll fold domain-containing protein [bacterium]
MGILDNLVAHWKLNEASGTRVDAHTIGPYGLADNNTVTQATGKIGNAAQFTAANSEWLTHGLTADLGLGLDTDFTLAIWVYLDSKPANKMYIVFNHAANPDADALYDIRWDNGTDRFEFIVGDGTSIGEVEANNLGAPSTATWYFIVAWHDKTADTLKIQVNDGTVDSLSWTNGTRNANGTLDLGRDGWSGDQYFNGRLDSASFWKRVLTSTERTDLYNGGAGLDYPFVTAAPFAQAIFIG